MDWLALLGVDEGRLAFRVGIHETGNVSGAEAFWAGVLGVPTDRLCRTVIKRAQPKTNPLNRGDGYYGLLTIRVRQSKELYQQVDGWMRGAADAMAQLVEAREREGLVAYPETQSRVVQGQDATLWKLSSWFESTPGSFPVRDARTGAAERPVA